LTEKLFIGSSIAAAYAPEAAIKRKTAIMNNTDFFMMYPICKYPQ
jgi:hypothetical protein